MTKSRLRAEAGLDAPKRNQKELPSEQALPHLLRLLASAVARVRVDEVTTCQQGGDPANLWKDEAYAYLEAQIPGMPPDAELDLYVGNGRAFVRIKLEDREEPTISIMKPHGHDEC